LADGKWDDGYMVKFMVSVSFLPDFYAQDLIAENCTEQGRISGGCKG
jgi:hypothetical protein